MRTARRPIKVFIWRASRIWRGRGWWRPKMRRAMRARYPDCHAGRSGQSAAAKASRTSDGKWAERDDVWVTTTNEFGMTKGSSGPRRRTEPRQQGPGSGRGFSSAMRSITTSRTGCSLSRPPGRESLYADFRPPSSAGMVGVTIPRC